MKSYIAKWRKLPSSIAKDYESGLSLGEVAVKYKSDVTSVRQALVERFKVKIRPPGWTPGVKGGRAWNRKLSDDELLMVLKWDKENMSHSDIARRLKNPKRSITRERIRQICLEAGHATRSSRIIPKDDAKRVGVIIRKQSRWELAERISQAWLSGASRREISEIKYGTENKFGHMTNLITNYRRRYGVAMFPYRHKHHWKTMTLKQRVDRVHAMSKEWKEYGSIKRIRRKFGYKSIDCANNAIKHLRANHPDSFPYQRDIIKEKVNEKENKNEK